MIMILKKYQEKMSKMGEILRSEGQNVSCGHSQTSLLIGIKNWGSQRSFRRLGSIRFGIISGICCSEIFTSAMNFDDKSLR